MLKYLQSHLLGQAVYAKISTQPKLAHTWTLLMGIPGALFLLIGLGCAHISLIRVLMK